LSAVVASVSIRCPVLWKFLASQNQIGVGTNPKTVEILANQ
jgi:hypothetical protein